MLGNEKIDPTYLGSIISKDDGCIKDVKGRTAKACCVFFTVENSLEEQEDKSADQDQNIGRFSDDNGHI